MAGNGKEPTLLQKQVLCRIPDEFTAKDIPERDRNVIATSFRRRNWVTIEQVIDTSRPGLNRKTYKVTELGKKMRKEYRMILA